MSCEDISKRIKDIFTTKTIKDTFTSKQIKENYSIYISIRFKNIS